MSCIIATKCTYEGISGIRSTTLIAIHRSHPSVSPNAIVNYEDSWYFHVEPRDIDAEGPVKSISGRFFLADHLMPIQKQLQRFKTVEICPCMPYKKDHHNVWLQAIATGIMDELLNCEDKFPDHPSFRWERNKHLLHSPSAGVLVIKAVISGEVYHKLFLIDNGLAWQIADDGFVCIHLDPVVQQVMRQELIESNDTQPFHKSRLGDLKKRMQDMFPNAKLKFW